MPRARRVELFNRTACELVADLQAVYGNDPESDVQQRWVMAVLEDGANPLVFDMCRMAPAETLDALLRRDASVLMRHKFSTSLGKKLQAAYRDMGDAGRDAIWNYIVILCKLLVGGP